MAKPPSKRRGITLGRLTDSAASLDLLSVQPAPYVPITSDQPRCAAETAGGDPGAAPAAMAEQLDQLRRVNADLDTCWQRQADELRKQLQQVEQQREQIALQARTLQALEQTRQTSGRLGVLLTLLTLAGVAALGFHSWPRLQETAGALNRLSTGVSHLAPELQAVRAQVTSLTSHMGQMGSAMASLREDITGARSDLGSLRRAADALPDGKGAVQADANGTRSAARTMPPNATTMNNPYWPMRPRMPW
jgi:prefoldin subunit 5